MYLYAHNSGSRLLGAMSQKEDALHLRLAPPDLTPPCPITIHAKPEDFICLTCTTTCRQVLSDDIKEKQVVADKTERDIDEVRRYQAR